MIRATGSRTQLSLAACAIAALMTVLAQAEMIDINLTGFRVDYSTLNDTLRDRVDPSGGNFDPTEAVKLTGSEFNFDNALVAQLSESNGQDTYADLLVENITPTLTLPSPISAATGDNDNNFGFDWFYDDGGTLRFLSLDFEEVNVVLIDNGQFGKPTLVVTGSTNSWTQSTHLPGGLIFDPGSQISFSYTTSNTMAFDISGNDFTDLLAAGGVMQLSGEGEREIVIPEPPTVSLALLAVCALAVVIRFSNLKKQLQALACPLNSRAT
jgi:hypothetical protein